MKRRPLVPIVGDIWEEKRSPSRTVEILTVEWCTYAWGQRKHEVTYRTVTPVPKRKPGHSGIVTEVAKFQQRFRKHYDLDPEETP